MTVRISDIRLAIRALDLSEQALCVHSSLRSFGRVVGGANAIVDGILEEGCTLLVPSFSMAAFSVPPPVDRIQRPERNGMRYDSFAAIYLGEDRIYTPDTLDVDLWMGIIPDAVIRRPERVRGNHPLSSFAASGPAAQQLIAGQTPIDVYAPLRCLAEMNGSILLMGVGLERMTLVHCAEELAGRGLFVRWANGLDGAPMPARIGSCSEGFGHFAPLLAPWQRIIQVGESQWGIFSAREILPVLVDAIRKQPMLTCCDDSNCLRCRDAVAGGACS